MARRKSAGVSSIIVTFILIIVGVSAGLIVFTAAFFYYNNMSGSQALAIGNSTSMGNTDISNITIQISNNGPRTVNITQIYVGPNNLQFTEDNSSISVPMNPSAWALVVNGNNRDYLEAGENGMLYINSSGVINLLISFPVKIVCQDGSSLTTYPSIH